MADLRDVTVPDIGDYSDVPVIEVHVAPGDSVAAEDPLVTLESDKATMDVPAPVAGTVAELLLKVGDTASEGTLIARISVDGAGGDDAAAPSADAPGAGEAPAPSADASAGGEAKTASSRAEPPAAAAPAADSSPAPAREAAPGESVYASPTVRRLARELGVDLGRVTGSGRKGRIVVADVQAAAQRGAGGGGGGLGLDLPPWPKVDFERYGEVERVPLSKIRRISAASLARNWVHIPHVTHNDEADITDLEAFRKQVNAEQSDVKVTMVSLLVKACAATLAQFPDFNSSLDGDELVRKRYFNIGFAADTPNGLVVPVVKNVDGKSLLELAAELTELSGKARAGKLGPAEMSGGTFTISSLGGIGGTSFTPIVNAPEVAILGVVRSVTRPVWDGAHFTPRLMLPLSLSYDHRVIDGAAAARFCAHLSGVLSDLRRVLL